MGRNTSMYKKKLSLLLIFMLVLGLGAGCGKKTTGEADTQTGNTDVQAPGSDNADENAGNNQTAEDTEVDVKEVEFDTENVTKKHDIVIDGSLAQFGDSFVFDGLGMVSANNSSRLLIDYKAENPEVYWQLLEYMFGESGMNLSLLKLEMGADVDSSSGTEPAVKRSADEVADVTRGAGFQLAADALTINPDLKLDMLYWGIPAWVNNAEDKHAALYQWYKEILDAAYDTYGIEFSYVTATRNERSADKDFIKYLAKALEEETDERYDYGAIKIVAGEGVGTWDLAKPIVDDEELRNAIDVFTSHYTSFTNSRVLTIKEELGKKIWFSEGSSPMSYEEGTHKYDGTGSGMSDINGMLDIATRITQAAAEGMTMYEFQPVISAYYDGVTYYPKQLITANEPWSGAYHLDSGFYMTMHFTQFMKEGWSVLREACFGDGKAGGDGHALVDSTFNYMTAVEEANGNFTTVLVNNSPERIKYSFQISNLNAANLHIWETKGPQNNEQAYDANYYQYLGVLKTQQRQKGVYYADICLEPYSLMTVTTLEVKEPELKEAPVSEILSLPYSDDYEYGDYAADYLEKRGMAPRYTTDQGGAFEVEKTENGNVLLQKINYDIKPTDWGSTPEATTNLGDDRWSDYKVSVDAHFADTKATATKEGAVNYVGVGARYNLADWNVSGYSLRVYEDGTCKLMSNSNVIAEASVTGLDIAVWHNLAIQVLGKQITCFVDGNAVIDVTDVSAGNHAGRVALYSDYQNNYFDNLKVEAIEGVNPYITRLDNFAPGMEYSVGSNVAEDAGWYFNTMCSYKNYQRTVAEGTTGDSVSFTTDASEVAFIGTSKGVVADILVDDVAFASGVVFTDSVERQCPYLLTGLPEGSKKITLSIVEGTFNFDAIEVK